MISLEKIKNPILAELNGFEPYFKSCLKSKVPLLDIITNYILRRKGKQMRPILVFLAAKMHGEINSATYTAAALIELLHTASLVHDDVVDNSHLRRGVFSINALWKSKVAVLVGDFLLSKGLLLAIENKEYTLLEIVTYAVKEMVEGELLQLEKARKLNITEDIYIEIIRKKTAALISACAACGTKSVTQNEITINKMKIFGENLGIAFQIKDDLFDYQKKNIVGKPTGNDLQEKKMTLPLIAAMANNNEATNKKIFKIVRSDQKTNKDIETVINFVHTNGGIEYTTNKMLEFMNKALTILDEFEDSPAKQSLIDFVHFTVDRNK